jgi:predicted Zn-dependent protease
VKTRKKWALILFLLVVGLGAGTLATYKTWRRTASREQVGLELLYTALKEFDAKKYDAATAMLDRRAAEVKPTSLDWMLRARIAEAQGRLEDALLDLKHIPDADAVSPQAWLKAGQIELALRHARAAEQALQRSIELDPTQIRARRELAYLYALQRRKADCDAQFRALAKLTPFDAVLAFGWCQNHCRLWDPRESGEVLQGFLAADPDDRWSRLALAISHILKNEREDAENVLSALPDSDADARALRIQIALARGEIARAQELAKDGPADHGRLNVMRGELALGAANSRQAADHFRAALRADPDDRDALHGLGMALQRQGDAQARKYLELSERHDQLKRLIQDSVATISSDPKLFFKLGQVCESLELFEEAKAWYQLAIRRDPLDELAQQALARTDRASLSQGAGSGATPAKSPASR